MGNFSRKTVNQKSTCETWQRWKMISDLVEGVCEVNGIILTQDGV
jgi:hypothetical protein